MLNASEKVIFHVFSRDLNKGEDKVSRLRKIGKVPGNIYGLKEDSQAVSMDFQAIKKLYASQGDTSLIYLQVDEDKKQVPVLIDVVDYSSVENNILHVTFKRVSLKTKIEADIPVEVVGEVKIDNSIVSTLRDTILVEALPADLPEKFEIDISELTEIGQTISISDLEIDKSKVSLILGEDDDPSEMTVVMIQEVKEEVEPEVEEVVDEEGETEGEGEKSDDGSEDKSESSEDPNERK